MMTDIEIAKAASPRHIREVAAALSIPEDALEYYGKYKAKLEEGYIRSVADRPDGKLVLVTAISPTPMGEGKTTTTVGLGEAMPLVGQNAIIALREPSLGPVFGIKGGAAGGGYARCCPWRTSTSTSPGTCTPSPPPTTSSAPCWTTPSSRGTPYESTPGASSLSAAWI